MALPELVQVFLAEMQQTPAGRLKVRFGFGGFVVFLILVKQDIDQIGDLHDIFPTPSVRHGSYRFQSCWSLSGSSAKAPSRGFCWRHC